MQIGVGVSARHIHLSQQDLDSIFGAGYQLQPERPLSFTTQFIARERLLLRGPKGELRNVALIGPPRPATQIEITKSDGYALGIIPPVRLSGNLQGSPGVTLVSTEREISISAGLIIAMRLIHMTEDDAGELGFQHRDFAMVVAKGDRSLVFDFVVVRVDPANTHTEFHIDTDEANASDLKTGDMVDLLHVNDKKLRLEQLINMFDERQLKILEQSISVIVQDEKRRLTMMEDMLKLLQR